jgi:hypothetical protein
MSAKIQRHSSSLSAGWGEQRGNGLTREAFISGGSLDLYAFRPVFSSIDFKEMISLFTG